MNLPAVITSGLHRTPFGLESPVDIKSSQDSLGSLVSNWWAGLFLGASLRPETSKKPLLACLKLFQSLGMI